MDLYSLFLLAPVGTHQQPDRSGSDHSRAAGGMPSFSWPGRSPWSSKIVRKWKEVDPEVDSLRQIPMFFLFFQWPPGKWKRGQNNCRSLGLMCCHIRSFHNMRRQMFACTWIYYQLVFLRVSGESKPSGPFASWSSDPSTRPLWLRQWLISVARLFSQSHSRRIRTSTLDIVRLLDRIGPFEA